MMGRTLKLITLSLGVMKQSLACSGCGAEVMRACSEVLMCLRSCCSSASGHLDWRFAEAVTPIIERIQAQTVGKTPVMLTVFLVMPVYCESEVNYWYNSSNCENSGDIFDDDGLL